MASTQLKRTNGSPTNDKIGTISLWLKRSNLSTDQRLVMNMVDGNNYGIFYFVPSDEIELYTVTSGSQSSQVRTTRKFRDTNAWMHILLAVDTTQGTATDRVKMYVNGVQETSFSQTDYFGQNESCPLLIASTTNYHTIGAAENAQANFDGLMSHVHFCDGTALAPTAFGETDSTTGEWKIKTNVSFTAGNNGYTILKDGNTITDQSANSNDFTLGAGTLLNTEDCPSNVYATLNNLDSDLTASDKFEYGNTKVNGQTPVDRKYYCSLTMGFQGNGKYYFEGVMLANNYGSLGLTSLDAIQDPSYHRYNNEYCGRYDYDYGYHFPDGKVYKNTSATAYGGVSWSANDYFSFAIDNTNQKMYVAKNGSWINSANPSNGTGGIDYSAIGNNVMFIITDTNASGYNKFAFNFGNGSINGATISTTYSPTVGDTGAKFKYNIIPTGFTALSTKGLNA